MERSAVSRPVASDYGCDNINICHRLDTSRSELRFRFPQSSEFEHILSRRINSILQVCYQDEYNTPSAHQRLRHIGTWDEQYISAVSDVAQNQRFEACIVEIRRLSRWNKFAVQY